MGGRPCEDAIWRQIVTVLDAADRGCDLFDIEELRREVDSWVEWADDHKPFAVRPYGDRAVWIGYDPAETGDSAGIVVVAPPLVPGGKFRVLERHQFKGMEFKDQAAFIEQITKRYWVTYIGVDATGMGTGVAQLVRQFFPGVTVFNYSPEVKARLVLKAYDVINDERLEYDAGCIDLTQSLLAIQKTITPSGRQVTYTAGRSRTTGHADLAWALTHALQSEPLEGGRAARGTMEIF